MSFNPSPLKPVQEVLLSQKRNKPHNPDIIFNGNPVRKSSYQKHWGMFLDILKEYLIKLVNLLVLFASFEICLPISSLLQVDKSLVRSYLD